MNTLRLGSVFTTVLISFAVIFIGLRNTSAAVSLPATSDSPAMASLRHNII
jgi:hypothetical protein